MSLDDSLVGELEKKLGIQDSRVIHVGNSIAITGTSEKAIHNGRILIKFDKTNNPDSAINEVDLLTSMNRERPFGKIIHIPAPIFAANKDRYINPFNEYNSLEAENIMGLINGFAANSVSVFEELPGRPVSNFFPSQLKPAQIARIMLDVYGPLVTLHQRGLVHRDVKPGNIVITNEDGVLRGTLIDYGLVDTQRNVVQKVREKVIGGTPGYMAMWLEHMDLSKPSVTTGTDYVGMASTILYCTIGRVLPKDISKNEFSHKDVRQLTHGLDEYVSDLESSSDRIDALALVEFVKEFLQWESPLLCDPSIGYRVFQMLEPAARKAQRTDVDYGFTFGQALPISKFYQAREASPYGETINDM